MAFKDDWNGEEIERRAARATGRGIIGIGERTAVDATEFAHVISGTLRRSIHTAPTGYQGAQDEEVALVGQVPNMADPANVNLGATSALEVGSWISYACVEETGRNHKFITPAIDLARGYSRQVMALAFREEGL